MSQLYLVLALILTVGVAIVPTQNALPVQIRFFVWHLESTFPLVILGSVAVGALLAGLISVPRIVWPVARVTTLLIGD